MKKLVALTALVAWCLLSLAQDNPSYINGNVQVLWQQYNEDSLIGAQVPAEKTGLNAFGNLLYTKGNFSAGIRYETYLPPVLGYPGRFKGTGIGYRFARYRHQNLDVTIGNFYDQFGSGLIYRTYEDRNLGLDNAMDGMRVIWTPIDGVTIKGLYGKQRLDFDSRLINGDGTIRAFDGEVFLNDAFPALQEKKTKITIGGSFVSKFQAGETIVKSYTVDGQQKEVEFRLPNNVGATGGRINVIHGGFTLFGEYVQKINDPNADNGFIYNDGQGIFAQAGYSQRGFGVNLIAKTVDNMSFRSDRDLLLFDGPINFIPTVTKQHTYNLAATLYPYATVINGESSYSAEVFYKFKKDTPLGGKYGTNITISYAAANSLDTTRFSGIDSLNDSLIYGYKRNSWMFGDQIYVRDFNVELKKKISKKLKLSYTYFNFIFNTAATPVTTDFKGLVYADIHVAEMTYKIKPKHSIRAEAQTLFTNQDKGDWATVLIEYNWSPHWFFSVLDQYNYGNPDPDKQVHYLYGTMGYINGSNRISVGYGKRREGIFCVGGVCRAVPASNGLEITVTSSF